MRHASETSAPGRRRGHGDAVPGGAARPAGTIRTCIGCGAKADQGTLVRMHVRGGEVALDAARGGGRGAWLHADPACLDRAVKRKAFARAFRASSVRADPRALRDLLTRSARKD